MLLTTNQVNEAMTGCEFRRTLDPLRSGEDSEEQPSIKLVFALMPGWQDLVCLQQAPTSRLE